MDTKNIKLFEDQIITTIDFINTVRIGFGEKDVESHKKKIKICKRLLDRFPEVRERMRKNSEESLLNFLKNRNLS